MDAAYIADRNRSFINRYKLRRRALEIAESLLALMSKQGFSLLDVGSADGALLGYLRHKLHLKQAVGLEPSFECLKLDVSKGSFLINGVGELLPFTECSFDVIVAASVIDHLNDADGFLRESRRVLKKDGLIAITAIVPFYDRLANIAGIDKGLHPHIKTFDTQQIADILFSHDFNVIVKKRFAMPTFGLLPFERRLELMLRYLHLDKIMFYSLVIGQRK